MSDSLFQALIRGEVPGSVEEPEAIETNLEGNASESFLDLVLMLTEVNPKFLPALLALEEQQMQEFIATHQLAEHLKPIVLAHALIKIIKPEHECNLERGEVRGAPPEMDEIQLASFILYEDAMLSVLNLIRNGLKHSGHDVPPPRTFPEWDGVVLEPTRGEDSVEFPMGTFSDVELEHKEKRQQETDSDDLIIVDDALCVACGLNPDACRGHGQIGDPIGWVTIHEHGQGHHQDCHPDACLEAGE